MLFRSKDSLNGDIISESVLPFRYLGDEISLDVNKNQINGVNSIYFEFVTQEKKRINIDYFEFIHNDSDTSDDKYHKEDDIIYYHEGKLYFSDNGFRIFEIYTLDGRMIYKGTTNNKTVDISFISTGLYIIKSGSINKKMIVS